MEATPVAQSYRELPEWQAAWADYVADEGSPEEVLARRVLAAHRMRDIEAAFEENR